MTAIQSPQHVAPDDATLVGRARDGDTRAYEQLVLRYQAPMFRLAWKMLNSRPDAEDTVQEVFLTAWRRLPRLNDDAAFAGWLYRLTINRCLNPIRSRRPRVDMDPDPDESTRADIRPEHAVQARTPLETLNTALRHHVTPEQRVCWLLREVHGLSYAAIGDIVGADTTAVRGRIARARAQLFRGDEAMAVNETTERDYRLPCGRDPEQVWERLDAVESGHADAHELDCPHCRAARESLRALREATRQLTDEPEEPPPDPSGRIMSAVRAEMRRGRTLALPTSRPGRVQISEQAVATVVRYAADSVSGVRARRCRVAAADVGPGGEHPVDIELTVAIRFGADTAELLTAVRERVRIALPERIGTAVHRLDVHLGDVYTEDDSGDRP